MASAHLLWGINWIAVDRSRGTGKTNHQASDYSCNPAARFLVHGKVAAATPAAMRNAFAAEQRNLVFTGGAHRKSPYRVYSPVHH